MAKKANLASALDDVTPAPVERVQVAPYTARRTPVIPSREGTVLVGAHLPAKYGKALKLLSAESDESQRNLLQQALDMLFVAKGAKL